MNPITKKSLLYRQLQRGYAAKNVCDRYYICKQYAMNAPEDEINMLLLTLSDADFIDNLPEIKIGNINITSILNCCKVLFTAETIRKRKFLIKILNEAKLERTNNPHN